MATNVNAIGRFLIAALISTSCHAADPVSADREQVVKRSVEWLLFDDWGRTKSAAEESKERHSMGLPNLRAHLAADKNVLWLIEIEPRDEKAIKYIYDSSLRLIALEPVSDSAAQQTHPNIFVWIYQMKTGGWRVSVNPGGGISSDIIIKKEKEAYVVEEYIWTLIYD